MTITGTNIGTEKMANAITQKTKAKTIHINNNSWPIGKYGEKAGKIWEI